MRIWNRTNRNGPGGMVTFWRIIEFSALMIPPKKAQLLPANGGAAPMPLPHRSKSQMGEPKFVEVCTHAGQGSPASNVPSTMPGATVEQPVGWADTVPATATTTRHARRRALVQVISE